MIATPYECLEIRAKHFEKQTGMLAPFKSEPSQMYYDGRDQERRTGWDLFQTKSPCICGKTIPDNWEDAE